MWGNGLVMCWCFGDPKHRQIQKLLKREGNSSSLARHVERYFNYLSRNDNSQAPLLSQNELNAKDTSVFLFYFSFIPNDTRVAYLCFIPFRTFTVWNFHLFHAVFFTSVHDKTRQHTNKKPEQKRCVLPPRSLRPHTQKPVHYLSF